jgi:hypothetical protein
VRGWLNRLFGRADAPSMPAAPSSPPRDERGWAEDWQVGDVAECIADDWHVESTFNPKRGDVLTVSGLIEGVTADGLTIFSALAFEGKPPGNWWDNRNFRKHRPAEAIVTAAGRAAKRRERVW